MQPPVIDETKNAIRNWLVESTLKSCYFMSKVSISLSIETSEHM